MPTPLLSLVGAEVLPLLLRLLLDGFAGALEEVDAAAVFALLLEADDADDADATSLSVTTPAT